MSHSPRQPFRLGICLDLVEEEWPSMELVATMLAGQLETAHADAVQVERLRPAMVRRATRLPILGRRHAAFNVDRLCNRLMDYPRYLARQRDRADLFHIADHSYAQLGHILPAGRFGVYCHDLDTFRCLLEPEREPRPRWFRAMMRHVLAGFEKASLVFHSTLPVGRWIEQHGLAANARIIHAPYGISSEFAPQSDEPPHPLTTEGPYVLHVGNLIPRKRIDVLLQVFAGLRRACADARLIQVGGPWREEDRRRLMELGIESAVCQTRGLSRSELAGLYRHARLVLQPSEAEGFGLPVAEALACGTIVLASDIEVLREVGGNAALYCPVADVSAWSERAVALWRGEEEPPSVITRLEQASQYSWAHHARVILEAYQGLLEPAGSRGQAGSIPSATFPSSGSPLRAELSKRTGSAEGKDS